MGDAAMLLGFVVILLALVLSGLVAAMAWGVGRREGRLLDALGKMTDRVAVMQEDQLSRLRLETEREVAQGWTAANAPRAVADPPRPKPEAEFSLDTTDDD